MIVSAKMDGKKLLLVLDDEEKKMN